MRELKEIKVNVRMTRSVKKKLEIKAQILGVSQNEAVSRFIVAADVIPARPAQVVFGALAQPSEPPATEKMVDHAPANL